MSFSAEAPGKPLVVSPTSPQPASQASRTVPVVLPRSALASASVDLRPGSEPLPLPARRVLGLLLPPGSDAASVLRKAGSPELSQPMKTIVAQRPGKVVHLNSQAPPSSSTVADPNPFEVLGSVRWAGPQFEVPATSSGLVKRARSVPSPPQWVSLKHRKGKGKILPDIALPGPKRIDSKDSSLQSLMAPDHDKVVSLLQLAILPSAPIVPVQAPLLFA